MFLIFMQKFHLTLTLWRDSPWGNNSDQPTDILSLTHECNIEMNHSNNEGETYGEHIESRFSLIEIRAVILNE